MKRIVDIFVSPKLGFDVCVSEDSLFRFELFAVNPEEAAVEGDGWEEGDLGGCAADFESGDHGRGESAEGGTHCELRRRSMYIDYAAA